MTLPVSGNYLVGTVIMYIIILYATHVIIKLEVAEL